MTNQRAPEAGRFTKEARAVDPDRFLCIAAAPAALRETLSALILFNHELVRATELPSARSGAGPIAALIRLQWWREVVGNERDDWRNQAVAVAVRALLDNGTVPPDTLLSMIAAREAEAEGGLGEADWQSVLLGGAGGLQRAIGAVLGAPEHASDGLAATGAAFACGALRRYLPALLAADRPLLPEGVSERDLPGQRAFLAEQGERFLAEASGLALPRGQGCALTPLVLARRDLRGDPARFDRSGGARGLGDRLAVIAAGLR
ncbi:squalene/phytoene synthase family protein [Acetobacteraceae bacterium KSS8]|uniref:Squalene/phytoene synthase family protein n=1 Tax=Endosaccharibacter trunci TaxID=2812733 RepID=A0ABT1WB88_9PROT|nr:squalene/phytoene synthase family protein [Acetobacteraceae bacterium KSS8]